MTHLAALLYYHLKDQRYAHLVPQQALEALQGMYRLGVARQLFFGAALQKILEALQGAGIPVIALKGAALVESVYTSPGLRPMADVDLLVPRERADAAYAMAHELGYLPTVDAQFQEELRASDRQLAALIGVGKPVIVEIHTHLVEENSPLRFDISTIWSRAQEATIAGVKVLVLAPEDLVAHLGLNFLKDRQFFSYSALGQLADIAEAVRYYSGGDSIGPDGRGWECWGHRSSEKPLGVSQ